MDGPWLRSCARSKLAFVLPVRGDTFETCMVEPQRGRSRNEGQPGDVVIRTPDRHLRVFVEDRGEGVPPQFVPELFERFTRGTRAPRVGGAGLGLAIARSYARAHDGDLVYEDAEPHGARFQLVLPVKNGGDAREVEAHRFRVRRLAPNDWRRATTQRKR